MSLKYRLLSGISIAVKGEMLAVGRIDATSAHFRRTHSFQNASVRGGGDLDSHFISLTTFFDHSIMKTKVRIEVVWQVFQCFSV